MWVLPTGVSILLLSVMPIIDHQIFGYLHHVHDFSKKLFDFKTTWEQQVWLPLLKTKFSVISPFIVHTKAWLPDICPNMKSDCFGCQIFGCQIFNYKIFEFKPDLFGFKSDLFGCQIFGCQIFNFKIFKFKPD